MTQNPGEYVISNVALCYNHYEYIIDYYNAGMVSLKTWKAVHK
jgi:hypothetical protein